MIAGFKTRPPYRSKRLGLRPVAPWANNLVGCWAMTEGSGSVVPDLMKRNDGVMATMTGLTAWQGDRYGYVNFQGTGNEHLLVKSTHLLSTLTNASVYVWTNNLSTNISGARAEWCERGASGNDIWKLSGNDSTAGGRGTEFTHRDSAGSLTQIRGGGATNDGVWHFHGASKQGTNVKLYQDGFLVADSTLNGTDTFSGTVSTRIGSDQAASGNDFEGMMFMMTAWNRALTEGEMYMLYQKPFIIFGNPMSYERLFLHAAGGAAVSPTGNINGPLMGPLGGPI